MDSEKKSRLSFYIQVVIGFVLHALIGDTSLIEKASQDLAAKTSRKKAIITVLFAILIIAVIASAAISLLGVARKNALATQTRANQATLIQDLRLKYMHEGISVQPQFFPIDDQFCVEATVQLLNREHPIMFEDYLEKAAIISFTLSGEQISLPAYYAEPEFLLEDDLRPKNLVILFKDQTNGTNTPAEGRYLLLPIVTPRLLLDFNQAMLMPCTYSGRECLKLLDEHTVRVPVRVGQMMSFK